VRGYAQLPQTIQPGNSACYYYLLAGTVSILPLRRVHLANDEIENGGSDLESGQDFGDFINSCAGLLQEARRSASGVLVVIG
jgi:hypothetical protein